MTDTERLDWIEKNKADVALLWDQWRIYVHKPNMMLKWFGKDLREAIDRAMAEEKNK